jgi:hypothetical protein
MATMLQSGEWLVIGVMNEVRHGAPTTFAMAQERSRAVACTGFVSSLGQMDHRKLAFVALR